MAIEDLQAWKRENPDHRTKAGRERLARQRNQREWDALWREIHADHGRWSMCSYCQHDPGEDELCRLGRRFSKRNHICLCKWFEDR